MHKFLIAPALVAAISVSGGFALASDDDDDHKEAQRDGWLTISQIAERYTSEGYDIREIEIDDGSYELTAIDKGGKRIEAYVDPLTGDMLEEHDDDDDDD